MRFSALALLGAMLSISTNSHATMFTNPSGSSMTVNAGDSYVQYEEPNWCAFANYGDLTVSGGEIACRLGPGPGLWNSGTVTVNGGLIQASSAALQVDSGNATIVGGTVSSATIGVYALGGSLAVQGGTIYGSFESVSVYGANAQVTGGFIDGDRNGIVVRSGTASISGGILRCWDAGYMTTCGLLVTNGGAASLRDATFQAADYWCQGWDYDICAEVGGVINVYGQFDDYGALPLGTGSFTWTPVGGCLQTISYSNAGTINLVAVPEPSSLLALAGGLGFLVPLLRRRK